MYQGDGNPIALGKWEILKNGNSNAVILACGERMINLAFEVCECLQPHGIDLSIINARFVKPIDCELLDSLREKYIITLEDNALLGGFGSVIENYFSQDSEKIVKSFGYKDNFIPHGSVYELMEEFGLCKRDIVDYILKNAN